MNAPFFPDHSRVTAVLTAVGERSKLRIIGRLPTGCVEHPTEPQPVVFLAEKAREDLSVLEVCSAEVELHDSLGYAARILLRSELEASAAGRILLGEVMAL